MRAKRESPIPSIDIGLCEALEGKRWRLGESTVRFGTTEKKGKLYVRPYPSGVEAYAYKVTDEETGSQSFIKFYQTELSAKRFRRLEWLISQLLPAWDDAFLGAPRKWVSTDIFGYPEGTQFELEGVMLSGVPGSEWRIWKRHLESGKIELTETSRIALARQLIKSLAILERVGLTHGDIAERNVMVQVDEVSAQLYLIDFDGFVYRPKNKSGLLRRWAIRTLRNLLKAPNLFSDSLPALDVRDCRLTVAENGTVGTENYAPPELIKRFNEDRHKELAPDTDWHARDVLLVELLCWGRENCSDECPLDWDESQRRTAATILQATGLPLQHLIRNDQLNLVTNRRPTTVEMAKQWSLNLPAEQELVAVDPLVGRGSSRHDDPSHTAKKRLEKILSYAVFLICLYFAYNRFYGNARNEPPATDQAGHSVVSSDSPDAETQPDTLSDLEPDMDHVRPESPISSPNNTAVAKNTSTDSKSLNDRNFVQPMRPTPAPVDLGYHIKNDAPQVPGWTYQRTYNKRFLFKRLSKIEQMQRRTYQRDRYSGFDFNADGSLLGVLRSDGEGCVVDTTTNEIKEHINFGGGDTYRWGRMVVASDGKVTALGRNLWRGDVSPKAMIYLETAALGAADIVVESATLNPNYFAVSGNGTVVVFADGKRKVTIVDIPPRFYDEPDPDKAFTMQVRRDWDQKESERSISFPSAPTEFTDARVGNISISDDGRMVAMGKFETGSQAVEVAVFDTTTLKRVWYESRTMKDDLIFIPKCALSPDGEFLFVYRLDEKRFQCTHLPSRRTVYSPAVACFGYSVVASFDTAPVLVGFTSGSSENGAKIIEWNPKHKDAITQHALPSDVESIIVSADGSTLALLYRNAGTVSLYRAD